MSGARRITEGPRQAPFACFLATQALGAFNDNAFRFALLFTLKAATDGAAESRLTGIAQALFALPFVLFAAWAGTAADRFGKSRIIVASKLAEVLVMTGGLLAFGSGEPVALLAVLFLMSTQSAFFGPAKYGWVAETVPEAELARANGVVQMTTMIAIVAGQLAGGELFQRSGGSVVSLAWVFVAVAGLGSLTAYFVGRTPAQRPGARFGRNPFGDLAGTWRAVRADPRLLYTMLGIGHFFMLSALLQIDLLDYGQQVLGLEAGPSARLVATAVVGIALGSLMAGRLSEGRVELGLVPFGALVMSVGVFALALCEPMPLNIPLLSGVKGIGPLFTGGLWLPACLVLFTGIAGGFFVVPLYALLQLSAPTHEKGRYLAFGNLVSFLGIGFAALFLWLPAELEMGLRAQFKMIALLSLAGTVVSLRLLPHAFVRFLAWLLAHSFYRISVRHEDRLPKTGGALLVANHVSWVDALILAVSSRRQLHFLMHRSYYEWKPTHWLFRMMGCIPIESGDSPEVVEASLRAAGQRLDEGRLVVIFAEGAVTRLGRMLPLRTGYQRIMAGRHSPIIPVHLGGLWGSIFSHAGGRLLWKLPRALPYPVSVTIGEALAPETPPEQVRDAVRALGVEAWEQREHAEEGLARTLRRRGRRSFGKRIHESGQPATSIARLMAQSALLVKPLRRSLLVACEARGLSAAELGAVGVLTTPGRDSAVLLLALSELAVTSLPLDAREGRELLEQRLGAAGVQVVLCTGELGAPDIVTVVPVGALLDALRTRPLRWRTMVAGLLPMRCLSRPRPFAPTAPQPAPIESLVFSRAGAVRALSAGNLLSAVDGLQQVLEPERDQDGILGILPHASAYGLVCTLWFPLLTSTRVCWVKEGDDGLAAGKAVVRHGLTYFFGTPGHIDLLSREAKSGHLGSLRLVVCGEGHLSSASRAKFEDRFGLAPTSALTSTACSGLVALNTPDVRTAGHYQKGTQEGSVGHPLPRVLLDVSGGQPSDGARQEQRPPSRGQALGLIRVRGACLSRRVEGGRLLPPEDSVQLNERGHVDRHGFLYLAPEPESVEDGDS